MFGSVNMMPDYTFTQEDNRLYQSNITKALSSYLGKDLVRKNEQNPIKEDLKSDNAPEDLKTKSKDKKDEKYDYQIKNNLDENENENEDEYEYGVSFGTSTSITSSFTSLAAAVGTNTDKISKQQLLTLLQSLIASGNSQEKSQEIAFVKNLIAQFDNLSNGKDYITSLNGVNEPQDYETVTKEQVTSPIDLRI